MFNHNNVSFPYEVFRHVELLATLSEACLRRKKALDKEVEIARKKAEQERLISREGIVEVFHSVMRKHSLPKGDMPNPFKLATELRGYDFSDFYKPAKER